MILEAEERKRQRLPKATTSDFSGYATDPVGFAVEVLGLNPWERQREIMQAVADHPRVAVRSCVNSGKSWAAAALVIWRTYCFKPSLVITTATTDRQVKGILWHEIGQMHRAASLPGRILGQELHASPTQRALGFTTNQPLNSQGWHGEHVMGIVDEAAGVPNLIFEALEGMMTSPDPRQLFIGNPNVASGTFYDSFSSPLYQQFKISAYDVPDHLLPAGWPEERRQEWGEDSAAYQVRVLGEFPEQGIDSLISLKWVTEAQEREGEAGEPCEFGYDVAGYGGDESVVYLRRGNVVERLGAWRDADTMASVGRVVDMARHHRPALIKVDSIGMGQPVYDRLRETLRGQPIGVVGVNVGENASDSEQFANRRSEIFWGLRERFKTGDISIPKEDTLLMGQLIALKFSYTSRGQIKLESKEDMRKNRSEGASWRSPDRADALSLCFAKPTGFRAIARTGPPRRAG